MAEYALRLQNGTDTGPRLRMGDSLSLAHNGPLNARGGFRPDGGGVVSAVAGTMTVQVSTFSCWVDGGSSSAQGGYPFILDAAKTLTIDPGDASQARVDTIAVVIKEDAFDGSGTTSATLTVVKGTPGAGAPVLPTTALPLRDINVPAGASSGSGGLSSANLGTDRRAYLAAGTIRVSGVTERDALNKTPGLLVYRTDINVLQAWNGTNGWDTYAPAQPLVVLREATTNQSIPNNNATKVTFGTTARNSGMSVSAGTVTVPTAGTYQVSAGVSWANVSGGGRRMIEVRKNADTTGVSRMDVSVASGPASTDVHDTLVLAAGDALSVWVYQTSSGALDVANSSVPAHLSVVRVGD